VELAKKQTQTPKTLSQWCSRNGYPGVTEECILSAFGSNIPEVQKLAKNEKLKGIASGGKKEKLYGRK